VLLLGLVVGLVYASALLGDFVWTDREDILQGGYRMHEAGDLVAALSSTRTAYRSRVLTGEDGAAAGSWQPLVALSNTLSWAIWGDCAFCFHLENLLLHGLLVVGLYALGRHLLSQRRHGNRIALWAAALFAVHPATVSSVAWIGGRPYLFAALFATWSLVMFSRLQATTKSHHGHERRWLVGLSAAALAAMLAHETAYMLPLLAILVAAFESVERGRTAFRGISPLRWKALALVTGVLGLVLVYRATVLGGLHFAGDYPTESAFDNAGTALRHLWSLIEHALLPGEPVVSDAWPVTRGWGAAEVAALLGLLVLLVATGAGLTLRHPSAFGAAWFLLWLIPGLGIFPSDHYHSSQSLYLATWGVTFALAYALFLLWRPLGRQLMPGSEAVVYLPIVLVLGLISGFSSARWWDHRALFESEIASDPHYMEGRLELAKAALQAGDAAAAMNHALAAIESSRDDGHTGYWSPRDAYMTLGRAQLEMRLPNEAAGSFRAVLEARPGDAAAHYWLGVAQLDMGEHALAEESLGKALAAKPGFVEAEADLGVALAAQQRFAEAHPLLAGALEKGLGNHRRHRAMAMTLLDVDELPRAAEQLELALAARETADERARLAWVGWRLGRVDKARSDLSMALQMEDRSSDYVLWVQRQMDQPDATAEPPGEGPAPVSDGTAAD
jgi:tetratricopeptide (TPR) repeat protein